MPKMLREVLRNLVSTPATINYPFVKPEPVPGTRGALTWDMDHCDQCQDCERVCPSMAIKVYPTIRRLSTNPSSVYTVIYVSTTVCRTRSPTVTR